MNKNVSDDDILKMWKRCGTVKSVSKELGISYNKVLKALSTKGVIINERHKQILDLSAKGISAIEIAEILHMNETVVKSYLPRVRPQYNINQSKNAVRIQKWRNSRK